MTEDTTNYVGLRCKNCDNPIDLNKAIHTPTGYICKDCQKTFRKGFDTSEPIDFLIGSFVAISLSILASFICQFISGIFGFFGYFLLIAAAGFSGKFVANLVLKAIRRHRSPELHMFITIVAFIGGLIPFSGIILAVFSGYLSFVNILFALITPVLFSVIYLGSFYYHLTGKELKF